MCSVSSAGVTFALVSDVPALRLGAWRLQITTALCSPVCVWQFSRMPSGEWLFGMLSIPDRQSAKHGLTPKHSAGSALCRPQAAHAAELRQADILGRVTGHPLFELGLGHQGEVCELSNCL